MESAVDESSPLLYSKEVDDEPVETKSVDSQSESNGSIIHIEQNESFQKWGKSRYRVVEYDQGKKKVGFMEHGSINSDLIVFYFTATNFNHKACPDTTGVLNRLNVRLVIIDRPGYGESTLVAGFNDTPMLFARNTFRHLLRYFGDETKKFFFIGHQMGCVYAMAVASICPPQQVAEMALICPPTPYSGGPQISQTSYRINKWCNLHCLSFVFCCWYKPRMKTHFESARNYFAFCSQTAAQFECEDLKYIKRHRHTLQSNWEQMYEAKDAGQQRDNIWHEWFVLQSKKWRIPFSSLTTKVHLWYGTKDVMAPYSAWYRTVLKNVVLHPMDGYGHLLIYPKFDQIIASMIHIDL